MVQLRLKKFDITTIPDNNVIVMLGKRETGKSVLVRDILYHHKDIPVGAVISETEIANKFYGHLVPSMFIHHRADPEIVTRVLKRQEKMKRTMTHQIKTKGETNIDSRAFLVLDDCLASGNQWINHPSIKFTFFNGRHYNLLVMITLQHPLGISPQLRSNIDYVFVLRDNLTNNRKRIYENYCGMFPTFEYFCQVMDQTTEDFQCLVIHNNSKSNKIEDQVFWYRAEMHKPFRLGTEFYWKMCNDCDSDGGDLDCDDDPNVRPRNKGPMVTVVRSPTSNRIVKDR
jgi:hypothetical protein